MCKYFKVSIFFITILCVFIVYRIIASQTSNSFLENTSKAIHLGVVQTTQNANISYISFYDHSLKFIGEKKIKYGDMGDDTRVPCINGDNMYTVPIGLGNQKELKIAMKFNLKSKRYKTYNIGQRGTLMFCVDNHNNIYTTNTFNFIGNVTKCNTTNGKLETWKRNGVIMSGLSCYDGILYSWGTISQSNRDNPYLFIYKTNPLKLIKTISIKKCGSCQYTSYKKNNDIYFTNNYTTYQEEGSNILSKLNTKNYTIHNINLKEKFPYQIFEYKNKLYITHCNPLFHNGNKITIYDPKTGKQQLITMKNSLVQCVKYKNYLYSQDSENLYIYDLDNLKIKRKLKIYKNRNYSNMRFFIGGFFINK